MHLKLPEEYDPPLIYTLRLYRKKWNCTPRLNDLSLFTFLADLEIDKIEAEFKPQSQEEIVNTS